MVMRIGLLLRNLMNFEDLREVFSFQKMRVSEELDWSLFML